MGVCNYCGWTEKQEDNERRATINTGTSILFKKKAVKKCLHCEFTTRNHDEFTKHNCKEIDVSAAISEITNNNEKLITFGQLLKIKREAMKLKQTEAANIMNMRVANLTNYETDSTFPYPELLATLVSFYKITDEEMKMCKERKPRKSKNNHAVEIKWFL